MVGIYVLLSAIGLFFLIPAETTPGNTPVPILLFVITVIAVGIWPVIGALIISHHPRHPVGWLLFASFLVVALDTFTLGYISYAESLFPGSIFVPGIVFIWLNWSGLPFVTVAITLMSFLFPTGKLPSPRWRLVAWFVIATLPVYLIFQTVEPGPLALYPDLDNPYAVSDSVWALIAPFYFTIIAAFTLCSLASVISLLQRMRQASQDVRQQVKWLVIPATLFWVGLPFALLTDYDPTGIALTVGIGLHMISVPAMAIATAFAIFKYRLYDVDLIINRTLVYGTLTAGVAGLYVLVVGGASLAFQSNNNLASALLTTALVALLFRPLRAQLQRGANRLMFGEAGVPPAPPEAVRSVQDVSTTPQVYEGAHSPSRWRLVARWIAWSIVGTFFILSAAGVTLQGLARAPYAQTTFPVLILLMTLVSVWIVIGALIVSHHPRHPVGWLLCAGMFFPAAFDMFSAGYAAYDTFVFPGSLPGVDLALVWLKLANLGPHGLAVFTLIVLLFPDGKFPSPGWRKVAWTTVGTLLVFLPLQAVEPGSADPSFLPTRTNPLGVSASMWVLLKPLMWTMFYILVLCFGAAFVSLIVRLRNSRGDVRQQIKWLLFPVGLYGVFLLLFIVGVAKADEAFVGFSIAIGQLALAGMVVAIAFAIFKYRLYDVDIILNRTLVYGALTACVVGLYALVVGGMGVLFQSGGNLLIALVATGLVAVLFQPLRARLQRGVNRMMYGERDDPFTVLRRLGQRLESSGRPEDVLSALVETVTQALKLPYAEIALRRGEAFERAAAFGDPAHERVPFPIQYQDQTVGYLNVASRRPGEALDEPDKGLLRQIARQAGPVAHAVQLTRDLRQSRIRLVTAREEERRRLRRDLHDGLGPVLASQGLKIAAVNHLLDTDPEGARKFLDELASENEATVAEIRRLVYALRPPELDELGLAGAIRGFADGLIGNAGSPQNPGATRSRTSFQVDVQAPERELAGLPAAVEVAAYRITTEALTNVTRHAQADQCTVSFTIEGEEGEKMLQLEIEDDGVGLPDEKKSGIGLNSMRERAEEVGGTFGIESLPRKGTRLVARLPLAA